eukprot:TRINITY_DN11068_c0_g1_i6.p1 TRINITY_DN11068_c0_g1~~TRINITY_DN11068_c0_g1_i6.p1  ORF type:complete len:457 (+),score=71.93 TRINITY_DN11068_c0_g1_i6:1894-3264(+)
MGRQALARHIQCKSSPARCPYCYPRATPKMSCRLSRLLPQLLAIRILESQLHVRDNRFGSDNPKRPTLGIVPRVFAALFSNDLTDGNVRYTISALEIYNEQLTDLLSPRDIDGKLARVQLREHPKKGHFVHGLLRTSITSLQDSVSILRTLLLERATGETAMNQRSSRSHVVVTIQRIEATSTFKKRSKLLLIDLAGSERVKKSNSSGMQIKEGAAINLSLSCLGNVIDALIRNRPHVPFRSSKLTRLLQDSLSGNCKTVVVATVSAARTSAEETLSTLRFADRIKSIQNEVYANDVAVSEKEQTQAANKVLQETNARIQKEKEALEAKVVELESRLLAMSRELQVARRAPQASTEMPSAPSPSPPSNAGYRRDIDDGSALSDIPSGSEYSDSDEEVDTRAAAEPQAIDKTYVVAKANKSATRRGADHTRGSGRDSSAARSSQPVGSTTSKSCSIQ